MSTGTASTGAASTVDGSSERADLVETLRTHRHFLLRTAQGLTDEQATATPTVSALCVGGIVKHVSAMEEGWVLFAQGLPSLISAPFDADGQRRHADTFRLLDGETLEGVLAEYARVAERTDAAVLGGLDLDARFPLPPAPWFPPNASRSARRALMHVVAETAQHAGHADIVREALDGQKTMG